MHRLIAVSTLLLLPASGSQLFTRASYSYGPAFGSGTGQDIAILPPTSLNVNASITASAAAEARSSYLGLGTYVLFTTFNTSPTLISEAGSFAIAQTEDVLTPGGGLPGTPGRMTFTFDVSGTNTSMLSGDPLIGRTAASTDTVLQACALPPAAVTPLPASSCSSPAATFNAAGYSHVPVVFSIGVVYGDPTAVIVSLTSQTGLTFDPTHAVSFSGVSDFLHTANLISVQLLDQNGQRVAKPTLVAESGTIYPLADTSAGGSVPEPSTFGLFLIGGGALCLARAFVRCRGWPLGASATFWRMQMSGFCLMSAERWTWTSFRGRRVLQHEAGWNGRSCMGFEDVSRTARASGC